MEVNQPFFELPEGEMVVGLRGEARLNRACRVTVLIEAGAFDEIGIAFADWLKSLS